MAKQTEDKRSVDLFSPLPPEEIARKLKAIMADPMPDARSRVFGKGSQHEMTLRYLHRNFRTNMEPVLDATMSPYAGGTRISGTFGPPIEARYFPCAWTGFLSIFIIVGIAVAILVPGTLLFGLIFTGVPLAMMLFGLLLFRNRPSPDEDMQRILDFLTREIDAQTVPEKFKST